MTAIDRVRAFLDSIDTQAQALGHEAYGDVIYGHNDNELRRSDLRTLLAATLEEVVEGFRDIINTAPSLTQIDQAMSKAGQW